MALPRTPQELTEYISFYNTTYQRSAAGGVRTLDAKVGDDAWAKITEGGGTGPDAETMQNESQTQDFEIVTQYRSDIKAWHSIQWGSPARQLDIVEPPQKVFVRPGWQLMVIHATEYTERDVTE